MVDRFPNPLLVDSNGPGPRGSPRSCGSCAVCIFQPIQLETRPAKQPRKRQWGHAGNVDTRWMDCKYTYVYTVYISMYIYICGERERNHQKDRKQIPT